MAGRSGIEQLLYVMDQAFEGHGEHALLSNLRNLTDEDLRWLPPGGGRTAFDILQHVGESKYAYENHAFGDGSMRWDWPGTVPTVAPGASKDQIITFVRDGQRRLRDAVAALEDDAELAVMCNANWGLQYETRWLVNVMVQHDLYHGGEINHLRALRQGNDRWAWEQASS